MHRSAILCTWLNHPIPSLCAILTDAREQSTHFYTTGRFPVRHARAPEDPIDFAVGGVHSDVSVCVKSPAHTGSFFGRLTASH
jgi:hypothetical protein